MKNNNLSIEQIKEEIEKLKGKNVDMRVNEGRKRYANIKGKIEGTYKSIFIVRIERPKSVDLKSYSYIDILCGNIAIKDRDAIKINKHAEEHSTQADIVIN